METNIEVNSNEDGELHIKCALRYLQCVVRCEFIVIFFIFRKKKCQHFFIFLLN